MHLTGSNIDLEKNRKDSIRLWEKTEKTSSSGDSRVRVRSIPYPYEAMLAICSDLDETPDRQVYFEIMRFLNTKEETTMGCGMGLEVGNTIYFDMPPDQFAYWNTDEVGRVLVRELIRTGHIDCLHSYGDLATTREHAQRALEELDKHECRLKVWVDHRIAPTNFDGDIMKGSGDILGSPAYHADLTLDFGVEYVWRGRVTSVIGQNVPRSLDGIWQPSHPLISGKTILKEFTKGLLAIGGSEKYAMHKENNILHLSTLRDGQKTYEFMRCNSHWAGVSTCETATGLAKVITPKFLDRLVKKQGFCILYTHLGKELTHDRTFPQETIAALKNLASYFSTGKILITTTHRLLNYQHMFKNARFSLNNIADKLVVECSYKGPSCDLEGLSFNVSEGIQFELFINDRATTIKWHPFHDGTKVASIDWNQLEFPRKSVFL